MTTLRPLRPPVTVSIAFVHGLLSGLRQRGIAPDQWLQHAGIDPALLDRPEARVGADQYIALVAALTESMDDEFVGLLSRPLSRGTLNLAMRSLLGCATIESSLRRFCKASSLLQDDVGLSLVSRAEQTGIRVDIPPEFYPGRAFLHEAMLRVLLRLGLWLSNGRLRAREFSFAIPSPAHAAEYGTVFPASVCFEQPFTAIWFDTAALQAPMCRDIAALREFMARSTATVVLLEGSDRAISARVRACLESARPRWLDQSEVAEHLHMSARTLQRHLVSEGTSFQLVKDQLRRDLAIARLMTTRLPLAQLAEDLGFSDSATFQRAFKAWTGKAPAAYRRMAP